MVSRSHPALKESLEIKGKTSTALPFFPQITGLFHIWTSAFCPVDPQGVTSGWQPLLCGRSTARVGQRSVACPTAKSRRGAQLMECAHAVALSPPAHRHALIALLAREVKRSGAVIVGGVHHGTSGNQEVDEGCLPYGTRASQGEGKRRHFPNPECEATTLFYPLTPWHETCPEVLLCLRGTRIMSSQTLQVQGTLAVALAGDMALVHVLATEGRRKESKKIPGFINS